MSDNDPKLIYKTSSQVSEDELDGYRKRLEERLNYLGSLTQTTDFEKPEQFVALPFSAAEQVQEIISEQNKPGLKFVFVIGMGGSSLGTRAVYEALAGAKPTAKVRRLVFIDNISPELISRSKEIINQAVSKDEILVNIVSKSGATIETLADFGVIYSLVEKKWPDCRDRFIFTTARESKLRSLADGERFRVVEIPARISGRFSVFSAAGLLPLGLACFDLESFRQGARSALSDCLKCDSENPALISTAVIFSHYRKGIKIKDNFFFNPELEFVGKWYGQLIGESLAKEKDLDDNVVNSGITPLVSIGTADLHSMTQLFLAGPADKLTEFIYAETNSGNIKMPEIRSLKGLIEGFESKSLSEIREVIFESIKASYDEKKLPFIETRLPEVSENTLGWYLQVKMIETVLLAKLMNIDPFSQPAVESYKNQAKKILS